jgi:hypothetical protein
MPNLTKKTNRSKKSKILRNKKKIGGGTCFGKAKPVESEDQVRAVIEGLETMSNDFYNETSSINTDVLETILDNICVEGEESNRQNNNELRTILNMTPEEYAKFLKELNELETQVQNNNS